MYGLNISLSKKAMYECLFLFAIIVVGLALVYFISMSDIEGFAMPTTYYSHSKEYPYYASLNADNSITTYTSKGEKINNYKPDKLDVVGGATASCTTVNNTNGGCAKCTTSFLNGSNDPDTNEPVKCSWCNKKNDYTGETTSSCSSTGLGDSNCITLSNQCPISKDAFYVSANGDTAKIENLNGKYTLRVSDKGKLELIYYDTKPPTDSDGKGGNGSGSGGSGSGGSGSGGSSSGSSSKDTTYDHSSGKEYKNPNGPTPVIHTNSDMYSQNNENGQNHSSSKYSGSGSNMTDYANTSNENYENNMGNEISSQNGFDYSNELPTGISKALIPLGEEDLYILKSQVVPPVCPTCPAYNASTNCKKEKQRPCPPCGRCPESPFECKKVPNYDAIGSNDGRVPMPILNRFSTFGM
jgi:uncharacterized membrane protein YgcG